MPRYIDVDKLLVDLKRANRSMTSDGWTARGVWAIIERQPAADVEPVRHGRWIPINRINPSWSQFGIAQHKCSECGSEEVIARKRCPEYGAKMDGEEDDEHL